MDSYIKEAAETYNVDPALIRGIVNASSGGDRDNVSSNGGRGLMGITTRSARSLGVTDVYNDQENIMAGTQLFSELMTQTNGDVDRALSRYNRTPGFPEEVKSYQAQQEKVDLGNGEVETSDRNVNFIGKIIVFGLCVLLLIGAFICLLKAFNQEIPSPLKAANKVKNLIK